MGIMSKYRQHFTRLVNAPHPDFTNINQLKIQALVERTEKVCEMAAVMKEAVRVDEAACNQQQETVVRLITENKGLRELLDISQRSLSTPVQRVKRPAPTIHKEVQGLPLLKVFQPRSPTFRRMIQVAHLLI